MPHDLLVGMAVAIGPDRSFRIPFRLRDEFARRMIDIGVPPDTVTTTMTNDVTTRQGARARLRRVKDARERTQATQNRRARRR